MLNNHLNMVYCIGSEFDFIIPLKPNVQHE